MSPRGTRKEAVDAARRLLQTKVDVVGDLAEASGAIDTAEDALRAAQESLEATRAAYAEQYRKALEAGWTDAQLTEIGCPAGRAGRAVRGRARSRRRRGDVIESAPATTTTGSTVASVLPAGATTPAV